MSEETKTNKKGIKGQSIGKGFVILSGATIAVKLMSLIFVPVMKNILGDGGYGVFGATNEVFAFVYVIATAGIPVAVSKIVSEYTATNNPVARERAFRLAKKITGIIGLCAMLLMMALSYPIALLINVEETWGGLICIAPTVFICSFLSVYRGYFQGRKNMTPTAISQIAEQVVHVAFSIAAAAILARFGIVWAVAGASLGTAAASLVSLCVVKYFYNKSKQKIADELLSQSYEGEEIQDREIIKKIFLYGTLITIGSGIQYGGNLVDVGILVGRLTEGGFSNAEAKIMYGQLLAARQLMNVASALTTALCVSILPSIAESFARGDKEETQRKSAYGYKLCFTVALPMAGAFALYSNEIYQVLKFGSNHEILSCMSFSVILMGIVHLQGSVLNSVDKFKEATINMAVGVAFKALMNFFLVSIPALNLYGAILSTYLSYGVIFFLNALIIRQTVGKCHFIKTVIPPAICTSGMLASSFGVYKLLYFLSGFVLSSHPYIRVLGCFALTVIFAVWIYLVLMGLTKGLTQQDVVSISPKLKRFMPRTIK